MVPSGPNNINSQKLLLKQQKITTTYMDTMHTPRGIITVSMNTKVDTVGIPQDVSIVAILLFGYNEYTSRCSHCIHLFLHFCIAF